MKKIHFFYCLIAVAGALALYSCLKENSGNSGEIENPITVAEAREILGAEVVKYGLQSGHGSSDGFVPADFTPDWDKAVSCGLQHGVRMTIPLVTSGRSVYAKRDSLPGDPQASPFYVRVSQSVVILRNSESGHTSVYIQSAVPDKECYNRNKNKLFADINDKRFSGFALYHRLDSRTAFLNIYREGRPSGQFYFGDCKSAGDLQQRFNETRSVTGRVSYVVNISSTRDNYPYEQEIGLVVVKAKCGCKGTGIDCGCEYCFCEPEPEPEEENPNICRGCGLEPPCFDCIDCGNPKCKCTCGGGGAGDDNPVGGGPGGPSGPGSDGGGSDNGNNPKSSRGPFENPDSKADRMLDTIESRCIGEALMREIANETRDLPDEDKYTNIEYDYTASSSEFIPETNTIKLNSDRSDVLFHETFHRYQCLDRGVYETRNSLNAEIEVRIAQYMYISGVSGSYHDNNNKNRPSSSGGTVISFSGYTEDPALKSAAYLYFEDDPIGQAVKAMADCLYPNGDLKKNKNAETKFRKNMKVVADDLIKQGYEGVYDPDMPLDQMLRSLRRIARNCKKK